MVPPLLITLVAATLALPAAAQQPKAFASGDPKAGALLHEKDCVGCHARKFNGDAEAIYTRSDRRSTTPEKLRAQIAVCNSELGKGYFPEEEEHLAAYLNLQYYKFKP
jgi:hypothetical protein